MFQRIYPPEIYAKSKLNPSCSNLFFFFDTIARIGVFLFRKSGFVGHQQDARSMTRFESEVALSAVVFNSESATFLAREYFMPFVSYMTLANTIQTQHSYSHTAIIDSGTNMHILQQTLFADNTYEKHSSVASFSGNTSRSTLRGDLSCTVLTEQQRMLHLHNTDSAIIVPDSVRNLLSVQQLT